MEDFDPKKLPADAPAPRRQGAWPKYDYGSYQELWYGARTLLTRCEKFKTHGWILSGEQNAIGVFLWTTGSVLDKRFTRQYPQLQ